MANASSHKKAAGKPGARSRTPTKGDAQINIRGMSEETLDRVEAWIAKVNAASREPYSRNAVLRAAIEWLVENEPDVMRRK